MARLSGDVIAAWLFFIGGSQISYINVTLFCLCQYKCFSTLQNMDKSGYALYAGNSDIFYHCTMYRKKYAVLLTFTYSL